MEDTYRLFYYVTVTFPYRSWSPGDIDDENLGYRQIYWYIAEGEVEPKYFFDDHTDSNSGPFNDNGNILLDHNIQIYTTDLQ